MANIDSLGQKSILEMDDAEGVSAILAIRLSRRTKKIAPKKKKVGKKAQKTPDVTPDQAARLLALLTGK